MKKWVRFYRRLKTMGVNGLSQDDFTNALKQMIQNATFDFSYQQEREKIVYATNVLVADVRQNPLVKQGFRPNDLDHLLEKNGMRYKRYPDLGNPFYKEKDKKPEEIKQKYLEHLDNNEKARKEVDDLLGEFKFKIIICLICYCKSQTDCHRIWLKEVLINKMRARLNFGLVAEIKN